MPQGFLLHSDFYVCNHRLRFPGFHAEMFFPACLTDDRMIWFILSFFLSFLLPFFLSFFLMFLPPIFFPCSLSSRHPLLPSFRTSLCLSRGQGGESRQKPAWVAASLPLLSVTVFFLLFSVNVLQSLFSHVCTFMILHVCNI